MSIDGHFISSGPQYAFYIINGSYASANSEGNKNILGGFFHNIHVYKLIGSLAIIASRHFFWVSDNMQAFQMNPFNNIRALYVQTGYNSYFFWHNHFFDLADLPIFLILKYHLLSSDDSSQKQKSVHLTKPDLTKRQTIFSPPCHFFPST